jgi:hypothetical protein
MMPAPAASVEEPPYREPELYFYQGEFIRKVAAPDFAHGFSMTNSVSSHTGRRRLKGSSCRSEIAMRVGSRFVLPRTRLIADCFTLAAPAKNLF